MTDELADLWVSSTATSPPAVDGMVRAALARRRREWLLTLAQVVVCVGGIVWSGFLGSHFSISQLTIFTVPAVSITVIALAIVLWTHQQRHRLPIGELVNEAFKEAGRTRVALWLGGAAFVGQIQLLLLLVLALYFLVTVDHVTIAALVWLLIMVLTAASLAVSLVELQRRAAALARVTGEARDVSIDAAPGEGSRHRRLLRAARGLLASTTRRLRPATPGSTVVTPAAPTSSAGLQPLATGHGLPAHAATAWRWMVLTVALSVLPQVMDGLAVLALQTGPRPHATNVGFDVPMLHLVMPYLPLIVAFVMAGVLPPTVIVTGHAVGRRVIGRFTGPILAVLLIPAAILTIPGALVGENGHLWCYSWMVDVRGLRRLDRRSTVPRHRGRDGGSRPDAGGGPGAATVEHRRRPLHPAGRLAPDPPGRRPRRLARVHRRRRERRAVGDRRVESGRLRRAGARVIAAVNAGP
jgi:hypothetical protein